MTTPTEFRIEEHLDALRRPGVFGVPGPVELVQTHISVVCLVGDRAFKLKKAVRLPFVDFSTLERRRAACEAEVALNRRLCPDVYLGVVPVRRDDAGLHVGQDGSGELVDHAVEMVRLPQARMLDVLLERGDVTPDEIDGLARVVARFHARQAERADVAVREAGAPSGLVRQIRANFAELDAIDGGCVDVALLGAVRAHVEAGLPALSARLEARAADGRIVEGHGDLHARNVCMLDPPVVYDCIEFRRDFRCGDVATEIAFLTMDLRYRGHPGLAAAFADRYVERSGDDGVRDVLPELERYRAMVRAKVDAIGAGEGSIPSAERTRLAAGARRHLRRCAWSAVDGSAPWLILASGLPASGKSFVFDALADETGWPVVATDRVRKRLAGAAPAERLPARFYAPAFSDRTYATAVREALAAVGTALVDGNFPSASRRASAASAARAAGRRPLCVHFAIDDATAQARLAARARDATAVSDAGATVRAELARRFEPPTHDEALLVLRVDGARPVGELLDRIATAMLSASAS